MPIAFPPADRGRAYAPSGDVQDFPPRYDLTNLGLIGVEFGSDHLAPGFAQDFNTSRAVNLRNMDTQYEAVDLASRPNPAPRPVLDPRFFTVQTDYQSASLQGISRDSTGTILGGCAIDLFMTGTDTLVASTVSDATTGAFWFSLMAPGPYYIVAYKPGSPDVAGTTVNTLNPG